MKQLSIKARVALWYTSFLLLMAVAGTVYLLSVSSQLSTRQQKEMLIDSVADAVKTAEFRLGELEDENVDYYNRGVSIFLYDTRGRLLAPRGTKGIQIDAVLEDSLVKKAIGGGETWLVYDQYGVQGETGFWVRGAISQSGTQESINRLILLAVIAIPILLLCAAAGGLFITKKAFAPVGIIARTADAITSGNDLSERIPEDNAKDELSKITASMNGMLDRLQASFEQERQFSDDVSHELRTPTAIILAQCEYAQSDTTPEEKLQSLSSIKKQAERISSITARLLFLARAENGRVPLQKERLNISELCEIAIDQMEQEADERQVHLHTEIEKQIYMEGDETLLIQLLTNLLSNAIHYNKPEGTVTLSLSRLEQRILLTIADTGMGIDSEHLSRIWNRFYRADTSRSSEGTGLGLPMVKWITQVHGGEILVESAVGVGTTFFVEM